MHGSCFRIIILPSQSRINRHLEEQALSNSEVAESYSGCVLFDSQGIIYLFKKISQH